MGQGSSKDIKKNRADKKIKKGQSLQERDKLRRNREEKVG